MFTATLAGTAGTAAAPALDTLSVAQPGTAAATAVVTREALVEGVATVLDSALRAEYRCNLKHVAAMARAAEARAEEALENEVQAANVAAYGRRKNIARWAAGEEETTHFIEEASDKAVDEAILVTAKALAALETATQELMRMHAVVVSNTGNILVWARGREQSGVKAYFVPSRLDQLIDRNPPSFIRCAQAGPHNESHYFIEALPGNFYQLMEATLLNVDM